MAVIEFENVAFSYAGRAPWLLENLSFTVNAGDYVSLLGENGCGTSTTLKMILGFLKPTAGRITVASPVSGYVPQADAALFRLRPWRFCAITPKSAASTRTKRKKCSPPLTSRPMPIA